jgi:tricorn protease-like protein
VAAGEVFCFPPEREALEDFTNRDLSKREKAKNIYQNKKLLARTRAMVRGNAMFVVNDWMRVHGLRRYV